MKTLKRKKGIESLLGSSGASASDTQLERRTCGCPNYSQLLYTASPFQGAAREEHWDAQKYQSQK